MVVRHGGDRVVIGRVVHDEHLPLVARQDAVTDSSRSSVRSSDSRRLRVTMT